MSARVCLRRLPPRRVAPRAIPTRQCRHYTAASSPIGRQSYSTPLAKHLTEAIKTTGPITLASYMRQCLTSPTSGYYTATRSDPFGRAGDFTTSPEISQMFGEMLGVWLVAEWMGQNRPKSGVQLIELGPGRGTLMSDILRTLHSFAALNKAIESIYLIEASPALRETQRSLLCGEGAELEELPDGTGYTAVSKYSDIPITWLSEFKTVPKSAVATPFIIAHEFFDALPVHAFEATKHGWRELMVTMGTTHSGPRISNSRVTGAPVPEFSLTRAPAATAHALLLPELSQRYKELKAKEGAIVEISPESMTLVEDIAGRIGAAGRGAALIIDYGPLDTIPINSLRGIRQHRTVSPFSSPGEVDISADVDFYGLAERALGASDNVEVHGPVEQGTFLLVMGMRERMQKLTKGITEDEKKSKVEAGFKRLVERGGGAMGKVYKAMAIIPERGGRRPVGFGGGVE